MFAQNVFVSEVHSGGIKNFVLRERMKALKDSIFSGVETTIKKSGLGGFCRYRLNGKYAIQTVGNSSLVVCRILST